MDKKEIHARLRSSLEFKQLWSYFLITAVILSLFLLFAVWRNPGEGMGLAVTVYGLFIAPYLIFCTIRTFNIFRKAEHYAFCKATLSQPHGGLIRDTMYFTALVIDPDTGEKFFADTHAIFFTRGIFQPLMETYANTTVTLACNRETGMVVVIG